MQECCTNSFKDHIAIILSLMQYLKVFHSFNFAATQVLIICMHCTWFPTSTPFSNALTFSWSTWIKDIRFFFETGFFYIWTWFLLEPDYRHFNKITAIHLQLLCNCYLLLSIYNIDTFQKTYRLNWQTVLLNKYIFQWEGAVLI